MDLGSSSEEEDEEDEEAERRKKAFFAEAPKALADVGSFAHLNLSRPLLKVRVAHGYDQSR